jgi:hypothetical protein
MGSSTRKVFLHGWRRQTMRQKKQINPAALLRFLQRRQAVARGHSAMRAD